MVSLPVDTLRIGTVLLSLLLLIDTISVVGQFTSPPQLELNTMIDAVLLKKDDQAQEMALKLMRESIAAQEHYAKPDMHTNATGATSQTLSESGDVVNDLSWLSEQLLAVQSPAVNVYLYASMNDRVRKVLDEFKQSETMSYQQLIKSADLTKTPDHTTQAMTISLVEKVGAFRATVERSLTELHYGRHVAHHMLPAIDDESAHSSKLGIITTASRVLNFSTDRPNWLSAGTSLAVDSAEGGVKATDLLVDAVIPVHPKDAATVALVVTQLRKHCLQLGTTYIVSSDASMAPVGTTFVPESAFPVSPLNFHKEVYQQLLKVLFLFVVPNARDNVLVLDADVIWLKSVHFLDDQGFSLYSMATFNDAWSPSRSYAKGGTGMADFAEAMLGRRRPEYERTLARHAIVSIGCDSWRAGCKCP